MVFKFQMRLSRDLEKKPCLSVRLSSSEKPAHNLIFHFNSTMIAVRRAIVNETRIRGFSSLTSSLKGPPQSRLVPPGECQFDEEFQSVALVGKIPVSKTSAVFRFRLPDESKPLNLSTCACILAKANIQGEAVIRPYTPISTNAISGSFDLLVKNYGDTGTLSRHLHESMTVGDELEFKHISFNVKLQFPRDETHIVMIAGGTGITPMIQALHAILDDQHHKEQHVTLIYGSQSSDDILARELLDQWEADYSDKLQVVHVLSGEKAKEDSSWTGHIGNVDMDILQRYAPATAETLVLVCGPPPMYESLCGPRDDPELSGILSTLGYAKEQVYKF